MEGVKYLHNFGAFAFSWVLLSLRMYFSSLFRFSASSPHLSERILRADLLALSGYACGIHLLAEEVRLIIFRTKSIHES